MTNFSKNSSPTYPKPGNLLTKLLTKNLKKENNTFSQLLINNCKISDPFEIANEFNDFFTSIAQKIADDIVPTDKPPDLLQSSPDDTCFNLKDDPLTHSEVYDAI